MPRYDPQIIIANIERLLAQETEAQEGALRAAEALLRAVETVAQEPPPPAVMDNLGHSILPSLRSFQNVGAVPPGTRFAFAKKILSRLLRLVAGPQTTHNQLTNSALQVLGEHLDRLRDHQLRSSQRLLEATREVAKSIAASREQGAAARTSLSAQLAEFATELRALREEMQAGVLRSDAIEARVKELTTFDASIFHQRIDDAVRSLWDGIADRDRDIERIREGILDAQRNIQRLDARVEDTTAGIWAGLADRDARIDGIAAGVAAAKAEFHTLHRRVDDTSASLWQGIDERDRHVGELRTLLDDTMTRFEHLLESLNDLQSPLLAAPRSPESQVMLDDLRKRIARIPRIFSIIRDLRQSIEDNTEAVWAGIAERDKSIADLRKSLDDRNEAIWSGIGERDKQLGLITDSTQRLHTGIGSMEAEIRELRARMLVLNEQLALYSEMLSRQPVAEPAVTGGTGASWEDRSLPPPTRENEIAAQQLNLAYLRFQRQYRGDETQLRESQQRYVELLEANFSEAARRRERPRILDVACGDGVFMDMLAAQGWEAQGVDINASMVKIGRNRGHDIVHSDALDLLECSEPGSYDAITSFQFVEHLTNPQLMRFLRGARRSLAPGGLLLIETINPETMMALHWYHLDLTHERLIFPDMLKLLCETVGLRIVTAEGIHPVAADKKLKEVGDDAVRANFAMLNQFLFGNQDYFLLARMPETQA